ncbi:hypothetical protein WEN_02275 [Mycoplasma wenyonii str. Massachusetts]|uniref:Uncharacterized protein n=1 Tax=Mycoplasma wenyonii (strain Massachusetts) TaxID=1197325 RepID=I6ZF79_MYCWM|nr:hypothetical protein [Mycoplasma wenyonii]AFN65242.1 hypothetical protein WEN_02275 [Mycoplasma wenyonii str. Massachusetts]
MVIPAVALKVLVGAIVCGSLATSIAVPVVMSKNSSSLSFFNYFPQDHKQKFQDKCQLIVKDESERFGKRKYLFACEGDEVASQAVKFYFYSEYEDPIPVKSLKEKLEVGIRQQDKVTIVLEGEGQQETSIKVSGNSLESLMNKSLSDCGITKGDREENRWTLKCPKGDSTDNTGILLTPIN